MSCGKFVSLGCPISCGKFLLPSPYLPVPTLDVQSPVVKFLFPSPCLPVPNSCGTCFLPTCQFRPWKSHSGLGSPMSCGKLYFPSPYLPVPALEVPCHVVNSSPWMSHLLRQIPLTVSLPASSHLRCPISCGKIPLPVSLPASSQLLWYMFPPYLPVPALEVSCHVVNSSPLDVPSPAANSSYRLPTCQFPP